ncbi:MAG: AraC family transcriptional regulator [Oscillospiraceae bacterium]|nr:AraC family transcriptional regulator [Oscillospiraceae bacterium]
MQSQQSQPPKQIRPVSAIGHLAAGHRFSVRQQQRVPTRGTPRAWHDEVEFFRALSGQITLHIEEDSFPLNEGEVIIVPPNMCHWATKPPSTNASYDSICFSGGLFSGRGERSYIGPLRLNGRAYILKLCEDADWQSQSLSLIQALTELGASADAGSRELEFCGLLFLLWSKIYHNSYINLSATLAYQKLHRRLQSAVNYIHEHFSEDVSSRTMANQVHLNIATFCRYFKQLMGETPISYLNNYRISRSRVLLMETNKKVADIAEECGYNNLSYFNRDFKNRMRCTPSEYRKSV